MIAYANGKNMERNTEGDVEGDAAPTPKGSRRTRR